jgi:hypothetical protein
MKGQSCLKIVTGALLISLVLNVAEAETVGIPATDASNSKAFQPQKHFSPYAGRNFPTNVYWGDTHLHTGMSFDAGSFGARLLPRDAYKFARGEEVTSSTGQRVRLSKPLDFLVVADHSDNMGWFPELFDGNPQMLADPTVKRWYDMVNEGGQTAVAAAIEIIEAFSQGTFPMETASLPGTPTYKAAWDTAISAAEEFNDPGRFTAFIGYEWTSNAAGNNLHRVVVYRDGGGKAIVMEPYTTFEPIGSPNPRDLWKWMQSYEDKTGGDLLAISHNGNLSNGIMFPMRDPESNRKFDRAYAETRMKWEPLYEVTQIKGDGETHPLLSPNDEFADYETWDQGNLDLSTPKKDDMLQYEYARSALQIGLQLQQKLGVNPYKFGMIGSTDSHTGLATAEEENFFGKHSGTEPGPERIHHPMAKTQNGSYESWDMVASGLAAVWAKENTREALFDAMSRRETYATTGPRMMVRFFGGWDFTESDTLTRLPANAGYSKGVPMGSDLPARSGNGAPNFLVAALKDPYSGNLDRIQIVKGWVDKDGARQEKVFDVVWSGNRQAGPDGQLPPVGNTVDLSTATWTNTIGAVELITVWTDPEFDPKLPAVYYARVLEIPTPRWTAYEEVRFGVDFGEDVEMTTQERAYTSPIWYTP